MSPQLTNYLEAACNFDEHSGSILSDYMSQLELARQLQITVRTLQNWQQLRTGPPVTIIGRKHYYRIKSVEDWLAAREIPMARESKRRRSA